jgi:Phytanoyl-CoA dioxygenase (PhyH)
MLDFQQDGLQLFAGAIAEAEMEPIEAMLCDRSDAGAGVRLYGIAGLREALGILGSIGPVRSLFQGGEPRPVRAILFDKTAKTNWALGWHQDRTIVVKSRHDVPGFGPWTLKGGLLHVAPPIGILESMVTVRMHLDDVDEANAPLLAAKGSHRLGRITEADIAQIVEDSETHRCLAQRGDIWAYSTPILHASDRASNPRRRRVLQVDYASGDLPGGLEWLGV